MRVFHFAHILLASAAVLGTRALAAEPSNPAPLTIGWANTQWPAATNHVLSVTNRTSNIYGQIWIDGVTSKPGATPNVLAQLGLGPAGSNPQNNTNWSWVDATFNLDVGNNDEFVANFLPEQPGTYNYLYRYSTSGGKDWFYADLNGPVPNGRSSTNLGKLTVTASGDTTPPAVPTGLVVAGTTPSEIRLAWRNIVGDPTLYGYEVMRSANGGNSYTMVARVATNTFTDSTVKRGITYFYAVRSIDLSFNRSEKSPEVNVLAERSISITFNVTVPNTTESTGKPVFVAGTLSQLTGGMPDWDPGAIMMNRVDSTHWTITLCGKEDTLVNYKYTLGSWDYVEKSNTCEEISDRSIKLKPGFDGGHILNDTALNWRNIAPCKD